MSRGTCMICNIRARLNHFGLYVIGSEGLSICKPCEMELVDHVRKKMRENSLRRKKEFIQKKAERVICPAAKEGKCKTECSHQERHNIKTDCHGRYCKVVVNPGPCQEY